ncbi:MAG TPA: 3-hydroxyacyl-CoA dehydrogenase family protein [Longimicrobiales bacterium]|nr:3-hydroxyacyl-CoA dehydrogenase family protein [Longimicrobiales bacterium]
MKRIERVAVIGAGTMGHGIAQVAAAAGCDVVLLDSSAELAERGFQHIRDNLDEGIKRGKVSEQERDQVLARIRVSEKSADSAADRDLIVEAVPERLDLKIAVLKEIETHAAGDAIIASNTSSLSISAMQKALRRPQRMLGMHFFNPVHVSRLVEIVRGDATTDDVIVSAQAFVQRIGKEAITVKDAPGFATSRLGVLLGLEAMRMLEEGVASAEDIDRALELGYRHPMGPLKLTDLVGLDVRLDIARYLHRELGAEHFRPPRILEELVAHGKLGKKSGEGFYKW